MSSLFLYFLLKLDAIIGIFCWIMYPSAILMFASLVVIIILLVIPFFYSFEDDWGYTPSESVIKDCKAQCKGLLIPIRRLFYITLPIWIISRLVVSLIPTSKEMCILYVVPKMANSEIIQKIPQRVLDLSEEWLEDLRPKNKAEGKNTSDNKQKQPLVSDNEE